MNFGVSFDACLFSIRFTMTWPNLDPPTVPPQTRWCVIQSWIHPRFMACYSMFTLEKTSSIWVPFLGLGCANQFRGGGFKVKWNTRRNMGWNKNGDNSEWTFCFVFLEDTCFFFEGCANWDSSRLQLQHGKAWTNIYIYIPRETETEEFVGFDGKPDVFLENPRFSGTTRFFQNRSKSAFSFFPRSPHRYCKRKVIWTNFVLVCVPGLRNHLESSV